MAVGRDIALIRGGVFVALGGLCALMPAPVYAEDAPDGAERAAATIIVTASRTAQSENDTGQSVSVIDETDIIRLQASDPASLLLTIPGVNVSRSGGHGALTSIAIRGALADHTAVLIDGVKVNDPASPGAGFDFGPLTMGGITRIEVVRGAQSVLYGSQAMGGVVNLITKPAGARPHIQASAEYGSRDYRSLSANFSGTSGPLSASIGGHYVADGGISAFNRARGGAEADSFTSRSANGQFKLEITPKFTAEARGYYTRARTDIDGFPPPNYALADTPEQSRRRDLVGYFGLRAQSFGGTLNSRLGVALSDVARHSFSDRTINASETYASKGRNRRFEYQGVLDLGGASEAVFGLEREETRYEAASFGGPRAGASTNINSIYGQLNLSVAPRWSVSAGLRRDQHKAYGSHVIFAASTVYTTADELTTFRARYGEGFKAPSLFQLFSDYGNRGLRPERSRDVDAGLTRRFLDGAGDASLTYFRRRARDLIGYISCFGNSVAICEGRPFGTYDNTQNARAHGWEFGLALRPVKAFDIAANYTRIDAYNGDTDAPLARQPRDKLNLSADYAAGSGFAFGASLLMVGDSFDDASARLRLDGYALAGLRAHYDFGGGLSVFGRIDNLFDAAYETAYGYGQVGRSVFFGLRWAR